MKGLARTSILFSQEKPPPRIGWRPPIACPFSRDTMVLYVEARYRNDKEVHDVLRFLNLILVKKCDIRAEYLLSLPNRGYVTVKIERNMIEEVDATEFFSKDLGMDILDSAVQVFEKIYKGSNGYVYIETDNDSRQIRSAPFIRGSLSSTHYVVGIDYERGVIKALEERRRDYMRSDYIERYYDIPDSKEAYIWDLGVSWGNILKGFSLWACLRLVNLYISLIRLANNKLQGSKMITDLSSQRVVEIGQDRIDYDVKADLVDISGLYFWIYFHEDTRMFGLDELSFGTPSGKISALDFFYENMYYSPVKKQAFISHEEEDSSKSTMFVVHLLHKGETIKIDWSKMWLMFGTTPSSKKRWLNAGDMVGRDIYTPILEDALRRAIDYDQKRE